MRILKYLLPFTCIITMGWAVSGTAQETAQTKQPRSCMFLPSIDSLEIINNQNIAFRMKNGDYYLNKLPNKCPMLTPDRVIMYKTPLDSLCDLDIINVLDQVGGGFQYYGSCGLGKFHPSSKAAIQQMKLNRTKTVE